MRKRTYEATYATKRAICAALKELMAERPLNKITIGEIMARCGMARQHFYYHFEDLYDAVFWMFEEEAVSLLRRHEGALLWQDGLLQLFQYLQKNRAVCLCALHSISREHLKRFFQTDVHVIKPFSIPDEWTKIRSVDFGFTNPFVCLWGALDHDGNLYIYRELYKSGVLTGEHAKTIRRLSGHERILMTVADHDAEERAELNSNGIPTDPAEKQVLMGIQEVQKRLKEKKLFFFSSLKHTLSEMDSYTWLPPSEDRNAKEEPRKLDDHAMDALRYMVMACRNGFEKSIKNLFRKCLR